MGSESGKNPKPEKAKFQEQPGEIEHLEQSSEENLRPKISTVSTKRLKSCYADSFAGLGTPISPANAAPTNPDIRSPGAGGQIPGYMKAQKNDFTSHQSLPSSQRLKARYIQLQELIAPVRPATSRRETKKRETTSSSPLPQKTAKPVQDINLTQAAVDGRYNPSLSSKTTELFSWESILSKRAIVAGQLLPVGKITDMTDAIVVKQLVGRGGYGEVYEVEYSGCSPYQYAMKVPLLPLTRNVAPFELEVEKLARLKEVACPHLPQILPGKFVYEGCSVPYYITYMLQPIEKLFDIPEGQPIYAPMVMIFFYGLMKTLAGLSYHHIIHNDIKPNNIMFYQDLPVLLDFGSSKSFSEINELELWKKRGYLHGTPMYFPPEVFGLEDAAAGTKHIWLYLEKVSQKMDIWAMGLVFMEWLSGRNLFQNIALGRNTLQILYNMQLRFQEGHLSLYKHQCSRLLERLYLATDLLTQQRMKGSDIVELYAGTGKSDEANSKTFTKSHDKDIRRLNLANIEIKENFVADLLKIFDLCTMPYEQRPKAEQIVQEVESFFPWVAEKYKSLSYQDRLPPITKFKS